MCCKKYKRIMKNILIVSSCARRRDTLGFIGGLLQVLNKLDKTKYSISLFDYNFYETDHMPSDYAVDEYYCLPKRGIDSFIRLLPKIRSLYATRLILRFFRRILQRSHIDIVVVYQVPHFAEKLVEISHQYESKIVFEPFGSDVLRVSGKAKESLLRAFAEVDGVVGRSQSNVMIAAHSIYNVPKEKLFEQRETLRSILVLKKERNKYTREEMLEQLGLPYSDYIIVCGYSGRESHRHKKIIESLIQVKDVLPENNLIVFPMTYGGGAHKAGASHVMVSNYAEELRKQCVENGLNSVFITDYLTSEGMAYLHFVTDLFIEIQPTDNGNAFMIEALFAKNQIITGRWLNYQRFEQFGVPYHLVDSPDDLPLMLRSIFTNQVERPPIPQKLIDFFDIPEGYDPSIFWNDLFSSL